MRIGSHRQDWDDLGELDPLWAVLSDPTRQFGQWRLEEFFQTGDEEIHKLLQEAKRLGFPRRRNRALDFGCAVGRLTRALTPHFRECFGVDISEQMINEAKRLNSSITSCVFIANKEPNLNIFPDEFFDFVLSRLVLQHIPKRDWILSSISDFIRVLAKDGLLIFQLPTHIPLRNRLQLRRRIYHLLKRVGFDKTLLYHFLGLNPIGMNSISEKLIFKHVREQGARLLWCDPDPVVSGVPFRGNTYYVSK